MLRLQNYSGTELPMQLDREDVGTWNVAAYAYQYVRATFALSEHC